LQNELNLRAKSQGKPGVAADQTDSRAAVYRQTKHDLLAILRAETMTIEYGTITSKLKAR
jgi:hypothetical protein